MKNLGCLCSCLVSAVVCSWCAVGWAEQASMLSITDLRCEYKINPLGLGVVQPRLSWKLRATTGARNLSQSAYRI